MNAYTIVTVVRALIEANQTDAQIAATLQRMGAGDTTQAPQSAGNGQTNASPSDALPPAQRAYGAGQQPTVNYRVKRGITEARLREMVGASTRGLEVGLYILGNPGQTKREINQALAHPTPGTTMSALHGLQMRGVVESVGIPGAQPGPLQTMRAPVPAAVVRRAYKRNKPAKRAR